MEGKGGTHAGPFQGQPAICCFGNDAELTGKGRKRLGSQLIAMGMQADGASAKETLMTRGSAIRDRVAH